MLRLSKYERGRAKVSQYSHVCPDKPKSTYTSPPMQVLSTISAFRTARASAPGTLGLVPTMGYLHRGHMALVERAAAENDVVAASIFVNPTQFGVGEDFTSYPRDLDRDLSMLESAGVSLVFTPTPKEMYRPGSETKVDPGPIATLHEGASRPGHFVGVATIVAKLFHIVKPDRAYFGQKDAQQLVIIKRMARDLDFDLEVVGVPTVREPDGLAISSRNVYLDPDQRRAATVLWKALDTAQSLCRDATLSCPDIKAEMSRIIGEEPLARLDYATITHPDTLEDLTTVEDGALALLAVQIGKTRLIDNLPLIL